MGVYYNMVCNTCKKYVRCGKLLFKAGRYRIHGLSSEKEGKWINDERCWTAIGHFLIEHQEHNLTFASDEVVLVQLDPYEPVEFDELIAAATPELEGWSTDSLNVTYSLVCLYTCYQYLNCGRLLHKNGKRKVQGLFSKQEGKWIDDVRCWKAVGQFLIAHQGHCLMFASDQAVHVGSDPYKPIEFDTLLKMAPAD